MKEALIIVAIVILLLIILRFVIANTVFSMATSRRKQQKPYNTKLEKDRHVFYGLNPEDVSIKTPDNLTLRGWLLEAQKPTKRFVVVVHGHKVDGTENFADQVPFYHETLNVNILMPDNRGHGRSEGERVTFGAFDHRDIMLWVPYLTQRYGEDIEIALHGISMGAATIMLANNSNPPEQIKFVVSDCGYTSAFEIIGNTFRDTLGFNCTPLVRLSSKISKRKAGFAYEEADCLGTIQNAARPMLFIHGTEDTYVPTEMGIRLFEACPKPKDMFLVEGAEHADNYYVDPEGYQSWVAKYAQQYFTVE